MNGSCVETFEANLGLAYDLWHRYRPFWPESEHDDLLQEILLALWSACRRHDPDRGALSTIATLEIRHKVANLYRKRRRRMRIRWVPTEVRLSRGEARDILPSPEDVFRAAMARILWREMPSELKAVALGVTQLEVARRFGIPTSTVSYRVKAAKRRLASLLGDEDFGRRPEQEGGHAGHLRPGGQAAPL